MLSYTLYLTHSELPVLSSSFDQRSSQTIEHFHLIQQKSKKSKCLKDIRFSSKLSSLQLSIYISKETETLGWYYDLKLN